MPECCISSSRQYVRTQKSSSKESEELLNEDIKMSKSISQHEEKACQNLQGCLTIKL